MESEFVRRIRAARGYAGLSQPALAEKLGVSKDTLARVERGERDFRGYERDGFIRAVAEATGMPEEFFIADLRGVGTYPDLLEPRRFQKEGDYSDEAMMQAQDAAEELSQKLREEFAEHAPAVAWMFNELLTRLDDLDENRKRVERLETMLSEFVDAWEEQGLPAAGLIQAHFGDADEEDEATTRTGRRSGRPAAGQ